MNRARTAIKLLLSVCLLWALLGGCAIRMSWPEHKVRVLVSAEHAEALDFASINALVLVYDAVELLPCQEGDTLASRALKTLHPAQAQAHGPTTPTRQGTPHIVDWALDPTQTYDIAAFEPPPGAYCGLRLDLGPADDDAQCLGGAPLMSKQTLKAGRDQAQDQSGWPLASTSARADVTIPFDQPWVFGESGDVEATLTLRLDLAQLLIDPNAWSEQDQELAGRALLARLPASISLEREVSP